jgi:hypothetical protein
LFRAGAAFYWHYFQAKTNASTRFTRRQSPKKYIENSKTGSVLLFSNNPITKEQKTLAWLNGIS